VWSLPDAWLEDGEILRLDDRRTLTVLHTPGHTRGHVVFVDGEHGVVFAGDHVLPHITPSVGYEEVPPPSPLAGYLTSLALLRQLPDARLLPAHGPVAPSVHQRVDELLDHHARRLELTVRPLARNALTGYEVARALRWTRRERAFDELDPFNQALATLETVAHLEVLAERGRVTLLDDASGVRRYRA
jgi:glyoxylase-like metal-dependent hydrolase (beta-lactamase superfamily II)